MLATGTNVKRAGSDRFVRFGFLHANTGKFRKLQSVLRGKCRGHVLNEYHGRGKNRWRCRWRGGGTRNGQWRRVGRTLRGDMKLRGKARGGAHDANLCCDAYFAQELVLDALHVEIDAAGRFGDKIDGAELKGLQCAGRAFLAFGADDDDGPRVGGHDLRGGLQAVHVRHVQVHGNDVRLQRFGENKGFAAVFGMANHLKHFVGVENRFQNLAHEGGIVDDENAKLFGRRRSHGRLSHRHDRACRLRSHELFDGGEELIFLHRLGEEGGCAFLHGAVAMLRAGARSDHHHGNSFGCRALTELSHQFIPGHAGHFQVGDHQMAAVLADEFGGFQTIGGELHAVAVLFQHAADEFADADGVVSDNNDALLVDAIDGFGGDRAASDGGGAGSKDARRAGAGLDGSAFVWFRGDHAVEIDQENQAAIGSDGGAWEELHPAEIFAEVFDDDFVFAEDFFHDHADLAIAGIGDNHAEVAVDGLEGRQAEIRVKADDLGDDVAHLGEQLAADVFDFVGAQAANLFDDGERKREGERAATDKERGRDDESQRHFQGELGAGAWRTLDFDFAVQSVEVGADDVEAHAAAGEFGFHRGSGEAGVEKHFAEIAFGEAIGGFRADEAAFDGALLDALVVDAAAVVFDFDIDVVAAVIGAERDLALLGLAIGRADVRQFDAMSDGVANEVDEGIGDLLDDVVVEFGFAAGEI